MTKRFGATYALRDINLEVKGKIILLLGPNGSGKTTFLKLMAGLLRPSTGEIRVLGDRPSSISRSISYMFERVPSLWWLTGRELLKYYSGLRTMRSNYEEIFTDYGIMEYWDKPLFSYSSGMLKKLFLALTISINASLYILDEPFTLLDYKALNITIHHLKLIEKEKRKLIIATHMLPQKLAETCDALIVLHNGKLLFTVSKENHIYKATGKATIFYRAKVKTRLIPQITRILHGKITAEIAGEEAEIIINEHQFRTLTEKIDSISITGIDINQTYHRNIIS